MTQRQLSTLQAAAAHLLDTLVQGRGVTLDVTAQDEATGGLLRLITEIHAAAQARRLSVRLTPLGERGVRLTLADP